MLGGSMTNQDEDEVEDELDALEVEVNGVPLPDAPTTELPKSSRERAEARKKREEEQREPTAMLA